MEKKEKKFELILEIALTFAFQQNHQTSSNHQ